jgi:uncharacterized phage protein gp47/JayE
VTVDSPSATAINISANITLTGTKTLSEVTAYFTNDLTTFLKSLVFETYTLSYAKIGNLLLSSPGLSDYSGLLVNSGTLNINIADGSIPTVGTVSLTEVS